jgi:GNAT superfamily N-acetyltransferase
VNPAPTLRAATPDDAALISRITREAWNERVDRTSSAYRETVEQIAAELVEGGGFILYVGNDAGGSVRYSPVAGQPAWEIRRMGVLPPWRGMGYALSLMNAVEAHAQRSGVFDLRLAVRHDQPRVVDVYSGMGFELAPHIIYTRQTPGSVAPTVMQRILSR